MEYLLHVYIIIGAVIMIIQPDPDEQNEHFYIFYLLFLMVGWPLFLIYKWLWRSRYGK